MEETMPVEWVNFGGVFVKHGRCWRRHDGSGWDGVGERCEGVLVRVLMRVLVLMLVLMELGPQVGWRAQGRPSVGTLGGQETRVQFLPQDILFLSC